MRFVNSVPGYVKSSQNPFSESTIIVWVLFWFCAHYPHIKFNFSVPNFVVPHFWIWKSCLEQYHLRACSPQCICPCLLHLEPRMVSRMILASYLWSYLCTLQTDLHNCCPRQSTSPHVPKIQTLPLDHNRSQRPWGLNPQHMYEIYTVPHQRVCICLGSLCRHKQNTRGTLGLELH